MQFGSEEHEAAIQRTLKAAKAAGKTAAIFCELQSLAVSIELTLQGTSGEQAKMRLSQGFEMVSIVTDVGALAAAFDRELAAVRGVEVGQARSAY